jgi:hypothetical protein
MCKTTFMTLFVIIIVIIIVYTKILAFGDSLTHGFGTTHDSSYPAYLQEKSGLFEPSAKTELSLKTRVTELLFFVISIIPLSKTLPLSVVATATSVAFILVIIISIKSIYFMLVPFMNFTFIIV